MGHAAAVVGDADPPRPAAIAENIDPAGAGIAGVLHEFLDHARGTFDHLGWHAVDDLFGELADGYGSAFGVDSRHGRQSMRLWHQMHGPEAEFALGMRPNLSPWVFVPAGHSDVGWWG